MWAKGVEICALNDREFLLMGTLADNKVSNVINLFIFNLLTRKIRSINLALNKTQEVL